MINIGPQLDEPRTHNVEVNGIKYKMIARDPYGFIYVTCVTANKNFESTYTSFDEARKAINIHAHNYKKDK